MNNYHVLSRIWTCSKTGNSIFISSRAIIRVDELEENDIQSVLSLGDENKLHSSELSGVTHYLCLDIDDRDGSAPRLSDILPETRLFIYEALSRSSVLVHCTAGISRSPTVVVDYIVRATGASVGEALEHVRTQRDCVNPRGEFLEVLDM